MVLEKELEKDMYLSAGDRTISVVGYIYRDDCEDNRSSIYGTLKLPKLKSDDETDEVVAEEDVEEEPKLENSETYTDQKGYIDQDGFIWIYSASGKPFAANAYPYFWFDEKISNFKFSDPPEDIKNKFSVANLSKMAIEAIIQNTEDNEVLFNEEEIADVNAGADVFVPCIKESDDFLKKIIKKVILDKNIDINRLKVKVDQKYQLPNMKAALKNDTKMSTNYYQTWTNLLDVDFQIIITDNGEDKQNPLRWTLIYDSYHDKVGQLINGEIVDTDTGKNIEEEDDED